MAASSHSRGGDSMIRSTSGWLMAVLVAALGVSTESVWAQTPTTPAPAPVAPAEEKKPEEKPKTLWDEFKLFSYIEMGATFNLHGGSTGIPGSTSTGATNTLRYYDIGQGYT